MGMEDGLGWRDGEWRIAVAGGSGSRTIMQAAVAMGAVAVVAVVALALAAVAVSGWSSRG
jgi:hypothetical protein